MKKYLFLTVIAVSSMMVSCSSSSDDSNSTTTVSVGASSLKPSDKSTDDENFEKVQSALLKGLVEVGLYKTTSGDFIIYTQECKKSEEATVMAQLTTQLTEYYTDVINNKMKAYDFSKNVDASLSGKPYFYSRTQTVKVGDKTLTYTVDLCNPQLEKGMKWAAQDPNSPIQKIVINSGVKNHFCDTKEATITLSTGATETYKILEVGSAFALLDDSGIIRYTINYGDGSAESADMTKVSFQSGGSNYILL